MKDSSSISTISSHQVKLLSCIHLTKRKKSSILSEVKSNPKEKSTPETTPTAGIGTSIRSNKNSTCPSVSLPSDNRWEEEPDSSLLLLTALLSIGSSHGPRMHCLTSLPDSWKKKILEKNLSDRLSLNSCLFHSKTSTNFPWNFMKSKEDTFIQLQNLSSNSSNSSRVCSNKREMVCWKTEKDMKMVLSSSRKLPNKSQSLKKKSRSKVLKHKKRRLKLISSQQRWRSKKKKSKLKTIRLKLKHQSAV